MTVERENLHASFVAINGRGVLILGPSGAGKSALALQLIAFGAKLVAGDNGACVFTRSTCRHCEAPLRC